MKYKLQELIDLAQFQSLLDRLNEIHAFPSAIIDNEGVILLATGWQDICTKFHRPNKECEKECIKSNQYSREHIAEANPAVSYRCTHGLIDNALPVVVNGHHLGFFVGQCFLEEPDLDIFREQARKFGFDEDAYLQAVKKVPVWRQEQLDSYLFFIKEMIEVLSSVGLKTLKEIEAAEALRKSEEKLSSTLNSIGDAVIAVDVEGCITRINPVAETMTGWTNAQALGMPLDHVLQIVHAATREKVENPVEKVLREVVTVGLGKDTILIARDGTEREIAVSTAPIREADGASNGFVLVFRDVTEAHEKYQQLREREKELNESQRIAHLGRWSFNIDNKEVVWSNEVYKMYRLDPTFPTPLYTDFQKLLTPQSWEKMSACIQVTLDTGTPFELEVEHGRMDGTSGWMWTCGEAVLSANGEVIGLNGVARDITDRKRAEERLRESQYFFKESQRAAFIGSYKTDFITDRWESSEVLDQIFGIDQDFVRTIQNWVEIVHPDDREMICRYLREEVIAESRPFNKEYRITRRSDGEIRWVNGLGEVHSNCEGKVVTMIGTIQDITDRKRVEEALRESEYRWKFAVEASGDGLWDWNVPENTLFFSPRWKKMLGFTDDEIGSDLSEWTTRVHPDDRARTTVDVQAHLAGTTPVYSNEHRVRSKDGSWKWILDRGLVVSRDAVGKPLRMIGTHTDLTERKGAEKALHDREQRLRSYFNSPIIGIAITSPEKGWLETNPRLCAMLGYSMEELLGGLNWADLTHPDDLEADVAEFDRLLAGEIGDYSIEKRFIRKNGEIIWTRLGVGAVRKSDGSLDYAVAILENITERKQAEEERERLLAAIEQVAETIVITDTEGAILYVNPFFEQTTGYTYEEATGQNPRILNSGEHDDAFYKEMWDTLTGGEVWTGRIVNKKKDGTRFTEEATISPVRNTSGKTVNYVAVKRDITHELALRAQLQQAQKMEAVGQLAGGIAHDFNNLLQAILGYGYLALREVGEDRPDHAFIEEMMRAGERATTLVAQLLAFSRRQVLDMKDVNLNDSIADVLKMLRRVIGEHITIDVISSHDLGIVRADPGQIDQILMNLCVNARDAMGKSGKITIETENVRIDDEFCEACTWARPGRYVLLSVTDTGCGMDQETLGKVFEPFFTTKDVGKGTGLGLATVYGVVRQHEGLVHVYSEVGQGTTFKIYLPLAERSSAVVGKQIEGAVPDGTETILLAEDNETLLKLTKVFLEHAGYTVLAAKDGQDALRVFEEHADEVDMALLDVMMPNLGGKAVFERIRNTRPDFPFLFASGYSMGSLHDNFTLEEDLQLIQKPFRRDDLLRKVREVLDGKSAGTIGNGGMS